ncbi:HNH endonuclease [Ihubacter sp. rT4E-8]|uniref:HNH endonuclease n=1 Tax=Ihubacter sp. rT4E-8 TaxID=3242369 RepID=UPI003CF2B72C
MKAVIAQLENENKRLKRHRRENTNNIIRLAVLERDNFRCVSCGASDNLQVHHKQHRKNGGKDTLGNLITLCAVCHARQHEGEPVHRIMNNNT